MECIRNTANKSIFVTLQKYRLHLVLKCKPEIILDGLICNTGSQLLIISPFKVMTGIFDHFDQVITSMLMSRQDSSLSVQNDCILICCKINREGQTKINQKMLIILFGVGIVIRTSCILLLPVS